MMVDHSGADRLAQGGQHVWFCGLTGACGFLKLDVVKGASTIRVSCLPDEYQATSWHSINAWAVELTGWHKEGDRTLRSSSKND